MNKYNIESIINFFKKKKYLKVIKIINTNIANDKVNLEQLEILGLSYLNLKFTDNAIIVFEHIKKKYPNYNQINIFLADSQRIKGNYQEASKLYKLYLNTDPKNELVLNNLGVTCFKTDHFKEAIKYYKQAISYDDKYERAYVNLAKAYDVLLKHKLVKDTLVKAIKLCKDKDNLQDILATHYVKTNNFSQAEKIYKKSVQNNTSNPHLYHNYGYYLQKRNINLDYAIQLIKKSIQLKNKFFEAYNTLGIVYYKKGMLNKAVFYYNKSLSINNNYPLTRHNLGVAYIRLLKKLNIAWNLRESRRLDEFSFYKNFKNKIWNGKDKLNSLYIWNEQGIGDEILFLNTVHLASKFAKKITVHLNYRIIKYYQNFLKTNKITNIHLVPLKKHDISKKNIMIKNHDAHISMASLPMYFLNDLKKFNDLSFPYLIHKRTDLKLHDKKFKIGLSWKTTNEFEQQRNLNLNSIKNLLKNNNYIFYNLQFGDISQELKFFKKNKINFFYDKNIDYVNNFDYLINLIHSVDLVLTIQNTVAHLCGATNKNFIIPLSKNCRLNWGNTGEKTPWYPSASVIRNFDNIEKKIEMKIKKTLEF